MKKLIVGILLLTTFQANACDGCNVYTPIGLNNSQNRIGIYARQRTMFGTYSPLGQIVTKHASHSNDQALWGSDVKEYYNTFEVRADLFFKENWQATFVVPYTLNSQHINNRYRYGVSGLSDPTILIGYNFISKEESKFDSRLSLGSGFRLPIGLTTIMVEDELPNLDLQPGKGAWSGLFYAKYLITNNVWGLTTDLNFKLNGRNKEGYMYGNSSNAKLTVFRQISIKESSLLILLGAYDEFMAKDESAIIHDDTGGNVFFGNVGLRWLKNQMILSAEFQPAVNQALNGTTQLSTKNRINIGLTYML